MVKIPGGPIFELLRMCLFDEKSRWFFVTQIFFWKDSLIPFATVDELFEITLQTLMFFVALTFFGSLM